MVDLERRKYIRFLNERGETIALIPVDEASFCGFGPSANKPKPGIPGRFWFETDTGNLVYDDGTTWRSFGVAKLSELVIDVDKDWGGHVIKNLGAPVDANDAARKTDVDTVQSNLNSHISASPIDHPDGSITTAKIADGAITTSKIADRAVTRTKLEYPTEDVSYNYLEVIGKAQAIYASTLATTDSFTDKASETFGILPDIPAWIAQGRIQDEDNLYYIVYDVSASTQDFQLRKREAGTWTTLGYEAVDLSAETWTRTKIECVGSTIKAYRLDMTTPKITATDTTFTSGYYGHHLFDKVGYKVLTSPELCILRAPASPLPQAKAIIEAEIIGSGTDEDPFRPNLAHEFATHDKYGQIDKLTVTWGLFDHKPKHNTMLIIITGDNPYQKGAILGQVAYAKSKNLKVLSPPKDYAEAVAQYKQLKSYFPEWIAGKDNYAYHVLGNDEFELFALADFYYGELIEHKTHYNQLKKVPDWEIRKNLERLRDKLTKVSILTDERDKHINKVKEVLKLGW